MGMKALSPVRRPSLLLRATEVLIRQALFLPPFLLERLLPSRWWTSVNLLIIEWAVAVQATLWFPERFYSKRPCCLRLNLICS